MEGLRAINQKESTSKELTFQEKLTEIIDRTRFFLEILKNDLFGGYEDMDIGELEYERGKIYDAIYRLKNKVSDYSFRKNTDGGDREKHIKKLYKKIDKINKEIEKRNEEMEKK